MNENDAKETIAKKIGEVDGKAMISPYDTDYYQCKGYLEGFKDCRKEEREKAEGLVEALDRMLKPYEVTEENYYLGEDDIKFAQETLAKWEAEK